MPDTAVKGLSVTGSDMAISRIPTAELRWRLDPALLETASPAEPDAELVKRLTGTLEAARSGSTTRRGHVFVRAAADSPRQALVERALKAVEPRASAGEDLCFVHNFEQSDRPRLLALPAGSGRTLELQLREISRFVRDELDAALQSRPIRNRLQALDDRSDAEMRRSTAALEKKLKPHGLVLVREQVGQLVRLTIHVQQTGRVITQDDLANLVAKGQVSAEEFEKIRKIVRDSQQELREITREINTIWKHSRQLGQRLLRAETRRLLAHLAQPLLEAVDDPEARHLVECIISDVLEKRVGARTEHLADPELLYSANLVHVPDEGRLTVVREPRPTPRNLGGTIDPAWLEGRRAVASFRGIRTGTLIQANGGFLLIDAGALLDQDDSISLLVNALGGGLLSIEAMPGNIASPAVSVRPDPVPIDACLVVTGSDQQWQRLQREHPDFAALFRAPLDVPDSLARSDGNVAWLAVQLDRACERLGLPPASPEAVGALIEQAGRMAGPGRLSTRIDALVDLARHAAVFSRTDDDRRITAVHIHRAVAESRPRRLEVPVAADAAHRFPVRQHQLGQVYAGGLAADGGLAYGQILRIQTGIAKAAKTRLEFAGLDREPAGHVSSLIEIVLGQLLQLPDAPGLHGIVTVRAESGPGRIEPAESLATGVVLALLSRLSGIPLRQDLMVLGNLDAEGRLGGIRGINEQIEDVQRVSASRDDAVHAGVIIPAVQRKALMLEADVIQAARNDLFQVYAAGTLVQVLELLIGTSPGAWREGHFTPGSLLARARERLTGRRQSSA